VAGGEAWRRRELATVASLGASGSTDNLKISKPYLKNNNSRRFRVCLYLKNIKVITGETFKLVCTLKLLMQYFKNVNIFNYNRSCRILYFKNIDTTL
jgi:hypothetical protein